MFDDDLYVFICNHDFHHDFRRNVRGSVAPANTPWTSAPAGRRRARGAVAPSLALDPLAIGRP